MAFKKYIHLERLGSQEVDGIEFGICHVFPKLDGTNASVWLGENGWPQFGSRSRTLSEEADNHGFRNTILGDDETRLRLVDVLHKHPDWNIYGEWLVPHTLKSYREEAWEIVKKYNRPTINFALLYKRCVERTKEHVKELFQ